MGTVPIPQGATLEPIQRTVPIPTGATFVPIDPPGLLANRAAVEREINKPKEGFLGAVGSDLLGMAKAAVVPPPVTMAQQAVEAYKTLRETGKTPEQIAFQKRRAEGRGLAYSGLAVPLAESLGVNVAGAEQAGEAGDYGGVVGHSLAVPTALALTAGATKGAEFAQKTVVPKIGEVMAREAVKQTLRPPPKAFRFGEDPVGFVIENGIKANSLPEFTQAIEQAVEVKKAELRTVLADAPPVDLKPAAQLLRDAIDKSIRARSVKLTEQLKGFYEGRFGGQSLTVSAADAADIRHGIQAETNWATDSKGFNSVKRQVQHEIGDAIHQAEPKSIALDEQVSSGIDAAQAAKVQELKAEAGNRPLRFGNTARFAGSALGAGAGAVLGGPLGAGAGASAGITAAELTMRGLSQPAFSTRVARFGRTPGLTLGEAAKKTRGR